MNGFRERLQRAISASDLYRKNVWGLSEDAGLGRKTVYNILRDERLDTSQTGPGIFGMARVAALLRISLDQLAGQTNIFPSTNRADISTTPLASHIVENLASQTPAEDTRLSVDALLRTYIKSCGRLEAYAPWIDRCDQYHPVAKCDSGLRVKHVGSKSLSAITMGARSKDILQTALDTVADQSLKDRWLSDYRTAQKRGNLTTGESLDVQMPNHPVRVKMDFLRCLLAVSDAEGQHTILNFSLLVV